MSEVPERAWWFYVDDMIAAAEKVQTYTTDFNQVGFESSGLHYDATVRNLEVLGEAATHIPETVRAAHAHIPWRLIIATRNRLIHGYLGIDNDTLWSIIRSDVPALLPQLYQLRDQTVSQAPEETYRMERFVDDDRAYLHWLRAHPQGLVVNCERNPRPRYLMLHSARCYTISGTPARGKTWTGPYIKICSTSLHDLERWAENMVNGTLQACKRCNPLHV